MSAVEGKSVQDDGSSVYSRTPSIEKPDDPESRGNGGGADELSPPISGCLCCEVSNGNQEVIGDCEKEKANDHSAKGKEKEPSCCSADGTCSKSKIRPPSLSSQITEDDNGLDSCCSGKATVWPTYSIGQPCPSISDENACCKADGECQCSGI